MECLFYAVENKNYDFLRYLANEVGLQVTLDSNKAIRNGMTLLHVAAKVGDDRIIYFLCERAEDINQ